VAAFVEIRPSPLLPGSSPPHIVPIEAVYGQTRAFFKCPLIGLRYGVQSAFRVIRFEDSFAKNDTPAWFLETTPAQPFAAFASV